MGNPSTTSKPLELIKWQDIKRVWKLIPHKKKPQAIQLLGMMILGMFLEMLGVGLILPIITFVTNPELIKSNLLTANILGDFVNINKSELVLIALLLLVTIYIFKNIYLAILAWKQTKFVFSTQAEMAKILFRNYIYQPYSYHLQRNSADLINNLQVELNLFMNYMLNPGMLLIAESLVIFGLVGLLIYFEPAGSIFVFTLFIVVGASFQWVTKKRVVEWGKVRQRNEALRMKHAQQGIGAIKDVKVSRTEEFFISEYKKHTDISLKMHQRNSFIQNITRLWLEILAISGLLILYIGLFIQNKSINEILPILGLFAAVSFRLMPSLSRMVSSINLIRFGRPITLLIENEYQKLEPINYDFEYYPVHFESEIQLKEVTFKYSSNDRNVLSNINIKIRKGQMLAIIGPSGSGKSTVVDILMGLLEPTYGSLTIDNQTINKSNIRHWQSLIGYVPQSIYITDDSLKRNVAFGVNNNDIDDKAVEDAIKAAQLSPLVSELPHGVNTLLGERGITLSGGQRQRIGIARALYHNPEVLILDEATSALDSNTEEQVMNAVYGLHGEKTIIVIAHRLSTIQNADIVIEIKNGRIANLRESV